MHFPARKLGKGTGLLNFTLGWKNTEPKDDLTEQNRSWSVEAETLSESPVLLLAVAKVSLGDLPLKDQSDSILPN